MAGATACAPCKAQPGTQGDRALMHQPGRGPEAASAPWLHTTQLLPWPASSRPAELKLPSLPTSAWCCLAPPCMCNECSPTAQLLQPCSCYTHRYPVLLNLRFTVHPPACAGCGLLMALTVLPAAELALRPPPTRSLCCCDCTWDSSARPQGQSDSCWESLGWGRPAAAPGLVRRRTRLLLACSTTPSHCAGPGQWAWKAWDCQMHGCLG